MPHAASLVIREEHRALAQVLNSMLQHLGAHGRAQTQPDFGALRAMLFYIDEFAEQRHHRKESELLFVKLRARAPQARRLLDSLEEHHAKGERAIRELEHALIAYEVMGNSRGPAFEQAVQRYADFYRVHMATEEREVLPLADRSLTDDDWDELDIAFKANRDPLTSGDPEAEYIALLQRIRSMMPASNRTFGTSQGAG
jgi:hemerythrin-like domain-containing protein